MRLSVVFELILVFLFLAFAAARVIEKKNVISSTQNSKKLRQSPPSRYCSCTTNMCNCCRDFSLPVIPIKGPGCASIMYLKGDNMMITMSFGERILSNTTIVNSKPKPVCMTLPGGISQFCGRVYGISRTEKNFKACLGLELRALGDIEAALRVSCFKFGPKGVSLESAPPIPEDEDKEPDEEDESEDEYELDDEEEDDDIIGFGGDLDDDDVDEDDDEINNVSDGEDNNVETDSGDYTEFSVLGEDLFGSFFNDDDSRPTKKKKKPVQKVINPIVQSPFTTKLPTFSIKQSTPGTKKNTKTPVNKSTPSTNLSSTKTIIENPTTTMKSILLLSESVENLQNSSTTERTLENQTKAYSSTAHTLVLPSKEFTSGITVLPIHIAQILNVTSGNSEHTEGLYSYETASLPTNELKLPDLDVEKIEAVVAIAQQGITPNVLNASSLSANNTNNLPENHEMLADKLIAKDNTAGTIASFLKDSSVVTEFKVGEKRDDDLQNEKKKTENESMHEDRMDVTKLQLNKITEKEDHKIKDNTNVLRFNKVKSHKEGNGEENNYYFGEMVSKDSTGTQDEEEYFWKSDEKEDENVGEEEAENEDDIFVEFIGNNEANPVKKDVIIANNNNKELQLGEGIEQDDFLSILDGEELEEKIVNKPVNENKIKIQDMVKIEQPILKNVSVGLGKNEISRKILLSQRKKSVHGNSSSDEVIIKSSDKTNPSGENNYLKICENASSLVARSEDKSNVGHDKTKTFVNKHISRSSKTEEFPKGSSNKKQIVDSQEAKLRSVNISRNSYQYSPIKFSNISSRTHRRMNLDKLDQS